MYFCLLFFGPPGVGKGAIAQKLEVDFGIPHVSSGHILRKKAENGSVVAEAIKDVVNRGNLVDDYIVTELVNNRLKEKDCANGFILDGFPRNVQQIELLDAIMKDLGEKIDAVIELSASTEILIERLSGRRSCKNCGKIYHVKNLKPKIAGKCDDCGGDLFQREDDLPETVLKRIKLYDETTKPLIEAYKKRGLLERVDCSGALDENVSAIKKILEKISLRKSSCGSGSCD